MYWGWPSCDEIKIHSFRLLCAITQIMALRQGTWLLGQWFPKLPKGVGLHAMRAYEEVLMWLSIYIPSLGCFVL